MAAMWNKPRSSSDPRTRNPLGQLYAMLTWSPKFSCSIRAIDDDHEGLFRVVEALNEHTAGDGSQERLAASINALVLYVRDHFDREERLMASARYPDLAAHKQEHERFTRLVLDLQAIHADNPGQVDIGKVTAFLVEWLTRHILGSDMKYVPYLRGEKEAPPSEDEFGPVEAAVESLSVAVPPGKADAVREFASLLVTGGQLADALEAAVHQGVEVERRRSHNDAVELFCR